MFSVNYVTVQRVIVDYMSGWYSIDDLFIYLFIY